MKIVNDVVADAFIYALKFNEIVSLTLSRKILKRISANQRKNPLELIHVLSTWLILNNLRICLKNAKGIPIGFYKGITILNPIKEVYNSDAIIVYKDEQCEYYDVTKQILDIFIKIVAKTPIFIIDLSLWELHHEKEKSKLLRQIALSINVIRKWLTDYHLILASIPLETLTKLNNFIKFLCPWYTTPDIYSSINRVRTLILDPYAEKTLTIEDIFNYDYFIIGGIVDRLYPRPYATYMIYKLYSLDVERRVIKLKDSRIGVPNEINKIIDIVLNVRFGGHSIEEAIVMNMSIDDKIERIVYDFLKTYKHSDLIKYDDVIKYMNFYKLSKDYVENIVSRLRRTITHSGGGR